MTKFKVGDWWRTHRGRYIHILEVRVGWLCMNPVEVKGYLYDSNGKSSVECVRVFNLIQKMKPPVWEEDHDK